MTTGSRTGTIWLCGAAALSLLAGGAQAAPKAPTKDARLWNAVEQARPGALDLLKAMVNIDSQTGDLEGAAKVQAIVLDRLKALGAEVRTEKAEAPNVADNLVATWTGKGKTRILIVAHIDTVFPRGTVAKWSFKIDGDRVTGPGVTDEKGGVVTALTALDLLKQMKFDGYGKITLVIDGSEELGSPGSTQLIRRLSREHDVELNMEPGDAPDVLTVWRKGSANIVITVKGRPAHAGVAPQNGRNAAVELIHQLAPLDQLPHSGELETVNLTVLRAGERTNVIPEDASATLNVRVRKFEDFDRIQKVFDDGAKTTIVPDTKVTVSRTGNFPPLDQTPSVTALAERAKAIYAELGRPIGFGGNGGASESALAQAEGIPALDGLGPVGGDFHTTNEWMDLTTFAPRIYLTTRLIMDLSANPPQAPTSKAGKPH